MTVTAAPTAPTDDNPSPFVPPSVPGSVPEGVPRSAPDGPPPGSRSGGVGVAGRRHSRRAAVLRPGGRVIVSRFTAGSTQDVVRAVAKHGGLGWFERQLDHENVKDAPGAAHENWWPHLRLGAQETWQRSINGTYPGWMAMRDLAGLQMTRRIRSRRQVYETMAAFWENHFHIPNNSDSFVWRYDFGQTLRRHTLGRFEDMLLEAAVHPAMLIWLDGATSTKSAPNENLGRELLELYTVGVGNYSEDDVKNAAKILTGWRVDLWRTWQKSYNPNDHWVGGVRVGVAAPYFEHANGAADGREVTTEFLRYLARHRDTAVHVCRKLVTKFVGDDPSDALVQRLADVYLDRDTEIKPVLRALVRSDEFRASGGAKLRDPVEDVIAVYRGLRTTLHPPQGDRSATVTMVWQSNDLGLMQASWPRPDGAPLVNEPWSTPLRALASTNLHWAMAGGWWPVEQIDYPEPSWWVPRYPISLRELVNHVAKLITGAPASDDLLESARLFLEYPTLEERVTGPEHPVVLWQMPRLLAAVLDSPGFYHH